VFVTSVSGSWEEIKGATRCDEREDQPRESPRCVWRGGFEERETEPLILQSRPTSQLTLREWSVELEDHKLGRKKRRKK
jgi:hypothetical protein